MIIKIAWRNIWRNKKRTLISTLSISGALFLIIVMRSMQFGFYDNLIKTVVESYSGYVQIHANGYWEKQSLDNSMEVDDKLINTITSIPGVENVVQRVQTFSLVSKDKKSKGAIINGIDINQEQLITDWNKRIVKGSLYLSHNDEVLLGDGVARYFNAELGDTLILFGQGYQGMMAAGKYKIIGILDLKNPQLNNLAIFMDIKSLNDYISS